MFIRWCCAYVFLGLGKNIFTFIWWLVNLYLLLGIDNLKTNKMKEFFLKVNDDKSLNGAYLSLWEGDKETVLIQSIQQATKKGWVSKKKIFENVDVLYKESHNDWIISEESADILIKKYGNVKVKKYYSYELTPPSAAHSIANFITKNGTDPYDRG